MWDKIANISAVASLVIFILFCGYMAFMSFTDAGALKMWGEASVDARLVFSGIVIAGFLASK
jgi:hypothetical protein